MVKKRTKSCFFITHTPSFIHTCGKRKEISNEKSNAMDGWKCFGEKFSETRALSIIKRRRGKMKYYFMLLNMELCL